MICKSMFELYSTEYYVFCVIMHKHVDACQTQNERSEKNYSLILICPVLSFMTEYLQN